MCLTKFVRVEVQEHKSNYDKLRKSIRVSPDTFGSDENTNTFSVY